MVPAQLFLVLMGVGICDACLFTKRLTRTIDLTDCLPPIPPYICAYGGIGEVRSDDLFHEGRQDVHVKTALAQNHDQEINKHGGLYLPQSCQWHEHAHQRTRKM